MKKQTVPVFAAGALAVVALWTTVSAAQDPAGSSAQGPGAPPVVNPEVAPPIVESRPNSAFFGRGIFAFTGAYVPSVLVAVVNENSYDKRLYVPLLGPWLDLADRPGCGGIGQTSCSSEAAFKVLLIVAGAVQGVGAVAIVLGATLPERKVATPPKADKLTLHVLPAQVSRNGYGMTAFGTF